MNEYKRKYHRATTTVELLQREQAQSQARLSAVDISWNMVRITRLLPSSRPLWPFARVADVDSFSLKHSRALCDSSYKKQTYYCHLRRP